MSMYAIGLTPLLSTLQMNEILQVAFVDDITGAGRLKPLNIWWDAIIKHDPLLGYHVEESKSWLVVKEENLDTAKEIFDGSHIKITFNGRKHLDTTIGDDVTIKSFIETKVDDWVAELNQLQEIATQPHLAFAAFIHGLRHCYVYIMRTTPKIYERLKPLDKAIDEFIKTLFQGHEFNTVDRQLLSLPPSHSHHSISDV